MRQMIKYLLPVIGASLLLAACGSSSSSSSATPAAPSTPATPASNTASAVVLKTAANAKLGATVLVNAQGMTLYHLTGEQNGKWICTSTGCLQAWHPVTSGGGAPSGSVGSLGTVARPGGAMQVTYKGEPLYTFTADQKPGDVKGQGIKDVGVWTAVTTTKASTSSAPAPAPAPAPAAPSSSGGGGSYGYCAYSRPVCGLEAL
jgi:predicted lipoprotein with Yx(FWY)xxD motif